MLVKLQSISPGYLKTIDIATMRDIERFTNTVYYNILKQSSATG